MSLQQRIDEFMRASQLRTVTDIIYYPIDEAIVVLRKMGYKNVIVDVSGAASPSEALEMVENNVAVY